VAVGPRAATNIEHSKTDGGGGGSDRLAIFIDFCMRRSSPMH
jgi:hypothetical protein